jgi:hypothetical protein
MVNSDTLGNFISDTHPERTEAIVNRRIRRIKFLIYNFI